MPDQMHKRKRDTSFNEDPHKWKNDLFLGPADCFVTLTFSPSRRQTQSDVSSTLSNTSDNAMSVLTNMSDDGHRDVDSHAWPTSEPISNNTTHSAVPALSKEAVSDDEGNLDEGQNVKNPYLKLKSQQASFKSIRYARNASGQLAPSKIEDCVAQIQEYQTSFDYLSKTCRQLLALSDDQTQKLQQISDNHARQVKASSLLQEKIDSLQAENAKLHDQIDALRLAKVNLNKERDALKAKLAKRNSLLKSFSQKVSSLDN